MRSRMTLLDRVGSGLVLVWTGVCLAGCAEHRLMVKDEANKPVVGARVTVYAATASYLQDPTGADGSVGFPSRFEQPARYLGVSKEGFVPIFVAYPSQWPCVLTIRHHAPATMPHTRR